MEPPVVAVEATVDLDRCRVKGHLRWTGDVSWVDPLDGLPLPDDDRTTLRTFPRRVAQGEVSFLHADGAQLRFQSALPRRFDDGGCARGAMLAHGSWLPLPLQDGALAPVDWAVHVSLPDGAAGVINGATGVGAVHWEGRAEQVSLAVVNRGVRTRLGAVELVTRGKPRRGLVRELPRAHAGAWAPGPVVVVEGPLRRRLARPGPGVAFVSDRAFRVTQPIARFHRVAVAAALAEAATPGSDPLARAVVGAVRADAWGARLRGPGMRSWLEKLSFLPPAHAVLFAGNTPFHGDLLETTWPSDPLSDDLDERFAPAPSGRHAAGQLDLLGGEGTAARVADALSVGVPWDAAVGLAGLPFEVADALRRPVPVEDWQLAVVDDTVTVRSAGVERTVAVVVGDTRFAWTVPATGASAPLPGRPVRLDATATLRQVDGSGERVPQRVSGTVAAWVTAVDFSARQLEAGVLATLRPAWNTRRQWSASVSTTASAPIVVRLAHAWKVGPLLDGLTRAHRIVPSIAGSWLDSDTAPVNGHGYAVDAGLSWVWDDRELRNWPLRGGRVSLGPVASVAPGSDDRALALHGTASRGVAAGTRWQVATTASASVVAADLPHRRLALDGLGNLASFPDLPACPLDLGQGCAPTGWARGTAAAELRWAVIRGASVPLLLAWGDELHVLAGPEVGALQTDAGPAWGVGAVTGAGVVADVLGFDPNLLALTVAWPVYAEGATGPVDRATPRFWLRWSQRF